MTAAATTAPRTRNEMIASLTQYGKDNDLASGDVTHIIREYITKRMQPSYETALAKVKALTPPSDEARVRASENVRLRIQTERLNEKLHPEPDYDEAPEHWNYWMRQIAHSICIRRGFVNDALRNAFVKEVTALVVAADRMGNRRYYLRTLGQQLRARGYGKRHNTKASPFGAPYQRPQAEIDAALAEVEAARAALRAQPPSAPEPEATNILPFVPHKEIPDAKDNPDWSAKEALIAQMQQEQEQAMQAEKTADKTTLNEAFPRSADNQPIDDAPAAPAWGDDSKKRGRFFQYYEELCDAHAVPKDQRDPIRKSVLKRRYGVDSLKGFNQPEADLLKALKAEIEPLYPLEMAGTQEGPSLPPETPKSDAQVSTTTPSTQNATVTKSEPQSGQAPAASAAPEIEAKPSAIIPYQPKAVAHTLNVDWKITPLEMAQFAVQSGLYKGIDSPAKAMVVMMRGLELGVSPLTALEQINIIDGKTAVSSALFLALIERSGQLENMVIDDTSRPDACTVTLTRRGRTPITATFTLDDAKRMGLAGKYNWQKMPRTMLYHRALGVAGRRAFSDVLLFGGGVYMIEEMQPDTVVDENGDVIAA